MRKDKKYKKFIDDLFLKSKSDFEIENFSDESFGEIIDKRLKGLEEGFKGIGEEDVKPLNFYLNNL